MRNKRKFCGIKIVYITVYRFPEYIFLEYDYAGEEDINSNDTVKDIYAVLEKHGVARFIARISLITNECIIASKYRDESAVFDRIDLYYH